MRKGRKETRNPSTKPAKFKIGGNYRRYRYKFYKLINNLSIILDFFEIKLIRKFEVDEPQPRSQRAESDFGQRTAAASGDETPARRSTAEAFDWHLLLLRRQTGSS